MSLTTFDVKDYYTGDGNETEFQIPFEIIKDQSEEVKVYLTDPNNLPDSDEDDLQIEGDDYEFFGAPGPYQPDTHIRFFVAPPAGFTITLYRSLTLNQPLTTTLNGVLKLPEHEKEYDRMTAMLQQVSEQLSRVAIFRVSNNLASRAYMPEPSSGKTLVWDDDGNFRNSSVDIEALAASLQAAVNTAVSAANTATAAANSASADAIIASNAANAAAQSAQDAADILASIQALIDAVLAQTVHSFVNNQSATNLTGEIFDSAVYTSAELTIEIARGNDRFYIIKKYLIFNGINWVLINGAAYSDNSPAHGLTFSISGTTTAQLRLAADNGGDDGTIKIKKLLFTA